MTDGSHERPGSVDWLTEALDTEIELYEPDGEHIRSMLNERLDELLDSVEHDSRERSRRPGPRRPGRGLSVTGIRLAGIPVGIAAAGLSAAIAVAVTVTITSHPHTQAATAASGGLPSPGAVLTTPLPGATRARGTQSAATVDQSTVSTKPESGGHSASASGSAQASASASASQPTNLGGKIVTAAGAIGPNSGASWTEEDVNVTLTEPVDSLKLVVQVAQSPGLTATGYFVDYDVSVFDVTVNSSSDGLVYTFELRTGKTLPAGGIKFAAQFQHSNSPHGTSGDTYSLSVTTDAQHGSVSGSQSGGF